MRLRRLSTRRLTPVVVAALSTVALVGTVALAYWTSIGTGTAPATADTPAPVVLAAGTPSSNLYPGGSADVAVTVSNPNIYAVRIGAFKLDTAQGTGGFAVDAGHSGCGLGVLSFSAQTNTGAGWTVPPKVGGTDGSLVVHLTSALTMSSSAAATCAGASFTVYLLAVPDYYTDVRNTAGLAGYWRLGEPPFGVDHFTGAAGSLLTAHSSDFGASWVQMYGESPAVLSAAGQMHRNGPGSSTQYATSIPGSADYAVEADLYFASVLAADNVGVLGRVVTGSNYYYTALYDSTDHGWHLFKVRAGGTDALACYCAGPAPSAGETHRLRLEMSGTSTTTVKLYLDGVLRASATDSSSPLTAVGKPGIQDGQLGAGGSKDDSTGIQLDNFRVVASTGTTVADSIGGNTGTFSGSPLLNEAGAITGDENGAVRWLGAGTYATVPDSASLHVGDSFTLEVWVQRADASLAKQTILTKGTNSFELSFTNNYLTLAKVGGATIVQSSATLTDTASTHHVVATKSGATVNLYIDGVDVTGAVSNLAIVDNTTAVTVGATNSTTDPLNAKLDELAIYDPALSAAVVKDHYRLGRGS